MLPTPRHPISRVPAYLINGFTVSLGISLAFLICGLLAGHPAAVLASSGAVYGSMADVPLPLARTWRRVLTACLIGCGVSLAIQLLRPYPLAIGLAVATIGFFSAMGLAWGPRAGPISFVGMLSFVFTMAAPPPAGQAAVLHAISWIAAGSALYLGWAIVASACLQARYRTLALASALDATARLLRARAALLCEHPADAGTAKALQIWIAEETLLDEQLQLARDHLFSALDDPRARQQSAILLHAIDLRDSLQLGQLDLDVLGEDPAGLAARQAIAGFHLRCADLLVELGDGARRGAPWTRTTQVDAAMAALAAARPYPQDTQRALLLPVLVDRARHLADDLNRIQDLLAGEPAELTLDRAQLQLFVSIEGWPLAALRNQLVLASPILRHAIRAALALASAYAIGVWLPWASHPHWLVLSVAVVLRGNLEQTLARRNQRIGGTVAGCLLVLLISHLATPLLSTSVFLIATGVSHAFLNVRYFVTASSATVMALLQDHLANPGRRFAIVERLADTVIGAVLAWAFSYVLPAWERRALPRLAGRLLRALGALATQTLRPPTGSAGDLKLRLARLEAYNALRAVAAAAQRSRVEPASVRASGEAFARLVGESHNLLAHLAAVRLLLSRRAQDLDPRELDQVLKAAEIIQRLEGSADPGTLDIGADERAPLALPTSASPATLLPWLQRRLGLAAATATRVASAARALGVSRIGAS